MQQQVNEIITFRLRSTLQFSFLSFYSSEKQLAHLCLYQIDCHKARMNKSNVSLYFLFVYNSRVASYQKKLPTKCNEGYVENIQREFPDGIPTPKTLCSVDR